MSTTIQVLIISLLVLSAIGLIFQSVRLLKSRNLQQKYATSFVLSEFTAQTTRYALEYGLMLPMISVRYKENFDLIQIRNRSTEYSEEKLLLTITVNVRDKERTVQFNTHDLGLSFPSWSNDQYWPIKSLVYESLGEYFVPIGEGLSRAAHV